MPNQLTIALITAIPLALFLVYAFRSMRREETEAELLKKRIAQKPGDIEACELVDNDPITVSVKFKGEPACELPAVGLSGVKAVQYFESLKALAPNAQFVVTQNGRPI